VFRSKTETEQEPTKNSYHILFLLCNYRAQGWICYGEGEGTKSLHLCGAVSSCNIW